jgi:hypothetical protein
LAARHRLRSAYRSATNAAMAFVRNLPEAARRNLQAAEALDKGPRRDVAGYLYGIAAECAVKHMAIPLQIPPEHDKKAILYEHFPELRTRLRDALQGRGRRTQTLWRLIANDAFMNNWHVKMRYADARQISSQWVNAWKQQAQDAINSMDT